MATELPIDEAPESVGSALTAPSERCARLPLSTFLFPVVALTSPAMGRKKKRNKAARLTPVPTKRGPARPARWGPWICLGLILLFVVVVRVRLLAVPLERD